MAIATPESNVPESHGNKSTRACHLESGVPWNARETRTERLATRTRTESAKTPTRTRSTFVSCNFAFTGTRPRRGRLTACTAGFDERDRDLACRAGWVVAAVVEGVVATGAGRVVAGAASGVVAGAVDVVVGGYPGVDTGALTFTGVPSGATRPATNICAARASVSCGTGSSRPVTRSATTGPVGSS